MTKGKYIRTEETKQHMKHPKSTTINMRKPKSEEAKQSMKGHTGKYIRTDYHKQRISDGRKGIKWTEEQRKKMMTNILTNDYFGMRGKHQTEAAKKLISEKKTGVHNSLEHNENIRLGHLGHPVSEAQKEKMRNNQHIKDAVSKANKGRVLTQAHKDAIARAHMNKPSGRLGHKLKKKDEVIKQ